MFPTSSSCPDLPDIPEGFLEEILLKLRFTDIGALMVPRKPEL
jgi:hypothetical protein